MTDRSIRIEQHYDAPRDRVWRAWTEPEHLAWFLNPDNPVTDAITVDLREGGDWRARMLIDAETDYVTGGRYVEIVPGERLVFLWGAEGGWPSFDDRILATIELADAGAAGTAMIATLALPDDLDAEAVAAWFGRGIREGWAGTLTRFVPAP